ncbi:glycosyltransferase family 4 protein [Paraclostridium sordellii]|uniref:glycosyltransferase family 4 protein n=1 Tax=Paraclostridium sordellii TaxID=1505 RepID=UPI000E51132A|nr:glycosyltransferase family 4 protein [Paeniclostridium sordellii]RGX08018.1 glycosyltransferase [Paeniclostridium sordellii]
MKIAMIGQKGIPAKSGGVEKHVEELSKNLISKGHDVTVYCRNTYVKDNQLEMYKGIKLKTIKTIENKSLDAIIYTLKATIHSLFIGKYDVYHYHALGPASLSFIPKIFGKKVIVTVHGLDWQRDKWGKFAKLYLKLGEYITGKFSNKIISVSKNLQNYFIKKYERKGKDVVFIPNGVNIIEPLEPNIIKKKYGLEKNGYILFLARLVPEKGAHYLINAYKMLNINKKLVIAGGSSFTDDYVKELQELSNNNKDIIFTGSVEGNEVIELYSNCLVYVLPSDIEGMPLTLLEAMSLNKFSVVSNIEECLDVIKNEKYGISFEKSNVNSLYNAITEALNLELNNNINPNYIKDYIKSHYNWNKVSNDTEGVYDSIL